MRIPYIGFVRDVKPRQIIVKVVPQHFDIASRVLLIHEAVMHDEQKPRLDTLHVGKVRECHERHEF